MGACESRDLHLFCRVTFIESEDAAEVAKRERLLHRDMDLIEAYCSRDESLEHLCFRVEEWIFDYAINTSFRVEDDHPVGTTFAVGIRKCFVPPPQDDYPHRPSIAAEMEHHWEVHRPDKTQLGQLLTHPDEQEICFTGAWFGATHYCQGLVLCCGPRIRRQPPHDGIYHNDECSGGGPSPESSPTKASPRESPRSSPALAPEAQAVSYREAAASPSMSPSMSQSISPSTSPSMSPAMSPAMSPSATPRSPALGPVSALKGGRRTSQVAPEGPHASLYASPGLVGIPGALEGGASSASGPASPVPASPGPASPGPASPGPASPGPGGGGRRRVILPALNAGPPGSPAPHGSIGQLVGTSPALSSSAQSPALAPRKSAQRKSAKKP